MSIERINALRGATTISANTAEEIALCTEELVKKMLSDNGVDGEKKVPVYCLVGTSKDVTAACPATVLRERGIVDCPMFSVLEPPFEGSKPLCIRVMIEVAEYAKFDEPPRHVYLNGATSLRPDLTAKAGEQKASEPKESAAFSVAIDGPSGAGKSTVAKLLSKRLNMTYLDTGAMYRAIGLKMHSRSIKLDDIDGIEKALSDTEIAVEIKDGVQHVFLDGKDVSGEIRRHYVSKLASDFSAVKAVRLKLVEMQRKIASGKDCILDGRDVGTFVLPDAPVKIFLTASPEVRARRRYDELAAKGENTDFETILGDIRTRDYNDTHRDFAPLKKADDATEIVTDDMTIDKVVSEITKIIEEKRGKK